MIRQVSVALLFGLAVIVQAQPHAPDTLWTRLYSWPGQQAIYAAAETPEGGFVLSGWTVDPAETRTSAMLICTDHESDTLWTRTFRDSLDTRFWAMKSLGSSGYIAAGASHEPITHHAQFFAVRTDNNGNVQWSRQYVDPNAEDIASDVEVIPDGGFALCGYSQREYEIVAQMYVIRTDTNGDTLWTHFYRQPGNDPDLTEAYDIEPVREGGFILVGFARSSTEEDAFVVRTDSHGDTLWTQRISNVYSRLKKIHETTEGGFLLAGDASDEGPGSNSAQLVKLDSSGHVEWQRFYHARGTGFTSLSDMQIAGGGCIAAGGTTFGDNPPRDFFYILRTDALGDTIWTKAIPTIQLGGATAVVRTHDNGYFVAGMAARMNPNASSVFIVRLDADPNHARPVSNQELAYDLSQNYPNPFNNITSISIEVPRESKVSMYVFNTLGERIAVLADGVLTAGNHEYHFDAGNLPSGCYFYELRAGGNRAVKMMTLTK